MAVRMLSPRMLRPNSPAPSPSAPPLLRRALRKTAMLQIVTAGSHRSRMHTRDRHGSRIAGQVPAESSSTLRFIPRRYVVQTSIPFSLCTYIPARYPSGLAALRSILLDIRMYSTAYLSYVHLIM